MIRKPFSLTNEALDYTLVAVTEIGITRQNLSTFGWLPLIEKEGKAILGEYLSIIQHPRGEVKQLAARENRLIDLLPNFLHYHTDTEPGSSGSPVFNDQWEVVGLHHSGVPDRDQNGMIIGWLANEGVRVSQLVKHIRSADLSDQKDHFRREMFDPRAHQPPEVEPTSVPKEIRRSHARSPFHPQLRDDGDVVWSIPLEISVKLGGRVETPVISEEPRSDRPTPPDQDTRVTQNKELRAALDEFKEASRRTY